MATDAEVRIILSHQRLLAEVRGKVARFAQAQYRGLGSWRDADIERFVSVVVPAVESGKVSTARLTQGYLATMARLAGVKPVTPSKFPKESLRGIPLDEVYARPFPTTHYALSQGATLSESIEAGAQRVADLVGTDTQMANVWASHDIISRDARASGFLRVLSESDTNCALCIIASTQTYTREDLLPIHPGCQCGVQPAYGGDLAAAQEVNGQRYLEVSDALREQLGLTDTHSTDSGFRDLSQIKVQQHGEYGPTLTWANQTFTGPGDIPAVTENTWTSSSGRVYKLLPS